MSLPLSHAGGSVDGISAALDLRFASSLSLTSTSGLTPSFSRASGGTFTGSDGLLKYTPLNTVLYSEQLDNVYWSRIASTISADSAVAPDGKTTADKLVETATTSTHRVYKETAGNINGAKYYWSFYAKASERSWVILDSSDATTNCLTWFNLSNGTIGAVDGARTASIQSVGNGWYRCSVYGNLINGTTVGIQAYTATGDGVSSFLGNSSAGLYIWGMQITRSESLGDYAQTTTTANSAPRFNHVYNGSSWVSKGLLVEEQRVNYVKYANDLSTNWANEGGATREYNSIASPDGSTNATKVNVAVSDYSGIYQTPLLNAGSGIYTYSIFAKKGTKDWLWILNTAGAGASQTSFNISNGTIGTVNSGYSATITNCGNGWYRCTFTTTTSTPTWFQFGFSDANNSIRPTSTGYSYVYGAQIELGSFATSFIPNNTASSVTRSADVCQITGSNFTSFWNASEGSFVTEADSIGFASTGSDRYIIAFNSSGTANIAHAIFLPTTGLSFDVYNSTLQARVSYTQPNAGDLFKLASCYKANDFATTLNGSAVQTDTSGTVPTINNVGIGHYPSFNQYANCHIARLRYFNKRLTNKQLEDLCKPEQQLKLDLNFSSSLSLTPTVGPTPSYSRASTGTYFNASGVLTSAAVNEPRFDHVIENGVWVSKGLLIEEQRTNLWLQSNNLNTSPWNQYQNTSTENAANSPDGTSNASSLVPNTSNLAHYTYQLITTSAINYSISFYAKKNGYDFVQLSTGLTTDYVNFNLNTGSVGNLSGGIYSLAKIESVGDGWYRCSVTMAATANNADHGITIINADTASRRPAFAGDGISGILLYGFQMEAGSFRTSHIPTTTASVTRSADVCQITGSAFTNLWNASEGSFAVEYDRLANHNAGNTDRWTLTFTNGSTSYIDNFAATPGGGAFNDYCSIYRTGSQQASAFVTSLAGGVMAKSSAGWKINDFSASFNGGAVQTDNSVDVPVGINRLEIGMNGSNYFLCGHIARLRYYAIRLPNRLLIAKST